MKFYLHKTIYLGSKILLTLCLVISPLLLLADPGAPCDDSEPLDNNCPLDTWIIYIVILVLILTAIHLKKKQLVSVH
jgi:hypothetical protein